MFNRLALKPFAPFFCPDVTPVLEKGKPPPCVEFYAGNGYDIINEALTHDAFSAIPPKHRQYLEDLLVLITTSRSKPENVYRGIRLGLTRQNYAAMKPGDVVSKAAFMSTADDFAVAADFSGSNGTVLDLAVSDSAKAYNIFHRGEDEWVFPPQSFYKIKKVSTVDGRLTIEGVLAVQPKFKQPKFAGATAAVVSDIVHTGKVWTELPDGSIR